MTASRKPALIVLVLAAVFGVLVGGLMTWHHDTQLYGTDDQKGELIGCQESAEVNCDIVNTSEYSELAGVPIATLGIAFYATVGVLAAMALKGKEGNRAILLAMGAGAVAYSGFLFWVSKTQLGYVCAWCIRLYGTNAVILLASAAAGGLKRPDGVTLRNAVLTYGALLLASAGGERVYRATLSGGGGGTAVAAQGAGHAHDPKGNAPELSFTVKTEDNQDATFSLSPDDAWTGNRNAKVAVVMFGDLECGYCKRSSAEIGRLEATYGDRVLFVFKHFPMNPDCNPGVSNRKHKDACLAAKGAVCAQEQGLFWAFHDLAYKNQHQLGAEYLKTYAQQVGADPQKFAACLNGDEALAHVRRDAGVGQTLGIHGTPRIFIDGKLYRSGSSAESMARAIEMALGASADKAAQAAAAMKDTEGAAAAAAIPADVPATRKVTFGATSFTIDTFEASIKDGKAVSGKHEIPAFDVSWFDAKAACEASGKRLCTEAEWVSACQNAAAVDDNHNGEFADDMIEGTAYPYGDYHDDNRCWDAHDGDQFRPVYTGELPGCATPTGLYDMTGNVEEWVGDSPDHAVLLGGAWDTTEDHARCYRRNDTFGAGYSSPRTGFRCCANP